LRQESGVSGIDEDPQVMRLRRREEKMQNQNVNLGFTKETPRTQAVVPSVGGSALDKPAARIFRRIKHTHIWRLRPESRPF